MVACVPGRTMHAKHQRDSKKLPNTRLRLLIQGHVDLVALQAERDERMSLKHEIFIESLSCQHNQFGKWVRSSLLMHACALSFGHDFGLQQCSMAWEQAPDGCKAPLQKTPARGTVSLLKIHLGQKGVEAQNQLPVPSEQLLHAHNDTGGVHPAPEVAKLICADYNSATFRACWLKIVAC